MQSARGQTFALSRVRDDLRAVLCLEDRVVQERPMRTVRTIPLVLHAYEIAANAYRQGGASSGQLKALESIAAQMKDLLR